MGGSSRVPAWQCGHEAPPTSGAAGGPSACGRGWAGAGWGAPAWKARMVLHARVSCVSYHGVWALWRGRLSRRAGAFSGRRCARTQRTKRKPGLPACTAGCLRLQDDGRRGRMSWCCCCAVARVSLLSAMLRALPCLAIPASTASRTRAYIPTAQPAARVSFVQPQPSAVKSRCPCSFPCNCMSVVHCRLSAEPVKSQPSPAGRRQLLRENAALR
jgi:hypothetical protein